MKLLTITKALLFLALGVAVTFAIHGKKQDAPLLRGGSTRLLQFDELVLDDEQITILFDALEPCIFLPNFGAIISCTQLNFSAKSSLLTRSDVAKLKIFAALAGLYDDFVGNSLRVTTACNFIFFLAALGLHVAAQLCGEIL
jgi:hypothetical protein